MLRAASSIAGAEAPAVSWNQSLGADNVFYNWSFGIFTAAWATLLGLVVPLCYIVAA